VWPLGGFEIKCARTQLRAMARTYSHTSKVHTVWPPCPVLRVYVLYKIAKLDRHPSSAKPKEGKGDAGYKH
jgi:hypothetical protein